MAQDSLQCLAQLASMHGPIFPDETAQVSYLAHLVGGPAEHDQRVRVTVLEESNIYLYILLTCALTLS